MNIARAFPFVLSRRSVTNRRRTLVIDDDHLTPGGDEVRSTTLLIANPRDPDGFVIKPNTPWLRFVARRFAASLDRQLAAGRSPESNRLLAARAELLTSQEMRRTVVALWQDIQQEARRLPPPRSPRVQICRGRIIAVDEDINAILQALQTHFPTQARGVAIASWLLSDGTGPVYRTQSEVDLAASLREATALLDPTISATW